MHMRADAQAHSACGPPWATQQECRGGASSSLAVRTMRPPGNRRYLERARGLSVPWERVCARAAQLSRAGSAGKSAERMGCVSGSEHGARACHFCEGGRVLSGWDFGCGFAFLPPSPVPGRTAGLWRVTRPGDASQNAHSQPSKETLSGALRGGGAGKSGCRSTHRVLPAGQALENAPNVEQRLRRRWASSLYGWLPSGGLVLLGRVSSRIELGIRGSPTGRSSAKFPGAPFPVQGACWRSAKCQTGDAIHNAVSTTTGTTSTDTKATGRKASQLVPKKPLHQQCTGA